MGFALFSDRHLTYKKAGPCRPLFPKWVVRFFKPNFDIRGEYLQKIHHLATHGRLVLLCALAFNFLYPLFFRIKSSALIATLIKLMSTENGLGASLVVFSSGRVHDHWTSGWSHPARQPARGGLRTVEPPASGLRVVTGQC